MATSDLKQQIVRIAHHVYKTLGSGFEERVYENAVAVGLRLAKIPYQSQKVLEIAYRGHYVGEGYSDLIVGRGTSRIVVELKATGGKLGDKEEQQLRQYLKILGIKQGLLINFQAPGANTKGKTKLEVREVSN